MTQLVTQNQATFARHETFHPRYGWLRKAVVGAGRDPELFSRNDATVQLGVGKNMVEAIRYWGQAFKLLVEAPNPTRPRLPWLVPSRLGRAMFSEDGWDPYVEAPGTFWVLHWWLLTPRTKAPAWWLTFNAFNAIQFTDAELTRFMLSSIELASGWTDVLESSVKKDVDCLIRMYSPRRAGQATDDVIDCPFRELGLVEPVPGESRTYRFVIGPKAGLPDEILAYSALDFMARQEAASTITIARLAQDVGSPGKLFKLTESAIFDSLARFATANANIRVAEPAGVKQLLVNGEQLDRLATRVLQEYYRRETGSKYKLPDPEVTLLSPSKLKSIPKRSIRNVAASVGELYLSNPDPKVRRQIEQLVRRAKAKK